MYAHDDDGIPTGELIETPPGPWDSCFPELRSGPSLTWPGALRLALSSSESHWVVYDEPAHAICVEPMTGPPDALNLAPRVVTPDEPLAASFEMRWERPEPT
jgi:aldose 1-epimerase